MRGVRPGRLIVDVAIACVVLAVSLGSLAHGDWGRDAGDTDRELDGLGGGLAFLMALPLAVRRIAPLPVFGIVTAATGALYALDYAFPPFAAAIALYTVARWPDDTQPRVRTAVLAASVPVLLGPTLVRDGVGPKVVWGAIVWSVAWFAGDRIRQRQERIAAAAERARQAEREAERERRLASAEERTRIARDLHDSAGHAVNVILVQAGAARLLLEEDPARSRAALETIEDVARETLTEIDQIVRALRDTSPQDGVEPPRGLAALETLVERSRAAGLEVHVATDGDRRALPPGVDQAAYRILREALTNAARHGTGRADVRLAFGPSALELEVANPVPAGTPVSAREGHGIVGMRERAVLLGGTLRTAVTDGSFRVDAVLPYREVT
jgi:signal transduction histidine kinase